MKARWSTKSPNFETRRKADEQFFAASSQVEFRDISIQRLTAEGDQAHLYVGLEMSAVNVKTGNPTED